MFIVDTSILVYAANEDFVEHPICKALVSNWCNQNSIWHISWGIVYEFMRVVTHPRVFQRPWGADGAWEFVEALLSAPGLRILVETDVHLGVAAEFFREYPNTVGNSVFDAHTAILMREHGLRTIYTRDTDFYKYAFVEVIDPLS